MSASSSPLGDIAVSQINDPQPGVWRLQPRQAQLSLLQVTILGVGYAHQDDVRLLVLGWQFGDGSIRVSGTTQAANPVPTRLPAPGWPVPPSSNLVDFASLAATVHCSLTQTQPPGTMRLAEFRWSCWRARSRRWHVRLKPGIIELQWLAAHTNGPLQHRCRRWESNPQEVALTRV